MIVSRVKAGFFVIGGATVLFCLAVMLAADSEPPITPAIGLLFLLSLTLMIIGVYFVKGSKPWPVCGERASRTEVACKLCGHIFDNARRATEHESSDQFRHNKAEKEDDDQHRDPMPASLHPMLGNFTAARKILPKINSIAAACYVALTLRVDASPKPADSRRDADAGAAQVQPHRPDV